MASIQRALAAPTNADSARRGHILELIRRRPAVYALVLGCAGAFLLGAYRQDLLIMSAGPAGVVALVLGAIALMADRLAARSFFSSFAHTVGLEYVDRWQLPALTPLLGAGDRQWCEHWMLGDVVESPRLAGGLGHFHYQRRHERENLQERRQGHATERCRLTVCLIDIEESLPLFKGIFLRQRRGLLEFRTDWLADTRSRQVEVESSAFGAKYELRVADDQDELLLRQLLSPSLVDWLARHPMPLGFELRAGALVVFVPKPLEDAGTFILLLEAARKIAARVVDEVREAAIARAPEAVAGGTLRAGTPAL